MQLSVCLTCALLVSSITATKTKGIRLSLSKTASRKAQEGFVPKATTTEAQPIPFRAGVFSEIRTTADMRTILQPNRLSTRASG